MSSRPRMIEMDVGQAEMAHVGERETRRRGALFQPSQTRRGARIDENQLVIDQKRRADRPVEAVQPDVDDAEALGQPRSSSGTKSRSRRPVKT